MNRRQFLSCTSSGVAALSATALPGAALAALRGPRRVLLDGRLHVPAPGGATVVLEPGAGRLTWRRAGGSTGWTLTAGLNGPGGIAVDGRGRTLVANTGNHEVVVVDRRGRIEDRWGGFGHGPGQLAYPQDVAVAADGRVLVCDTLNHRVQVRRADGTGLGAMEDGLNGPRSVATGPDGRVFVADPGNARVLVLSGPLGRSIASLGPGRGSPFTPRSVAVDPAGRLHVVDAVAGEVLTWSPAGRLLERWRPPMAPRLVACGGEGLCVMGAA